MAKRRKDESPERQVLREMVRHLLLNVNTSCMLYAHQPELPKGVEKLRKF